MTNIYLLSCCFCRSEIQTEVSCTLCFRFSPSWGYNQGANLGSTDKRSSIYFQVHSKWLLMGFSSLPGGPLEHTGIARENISKTKFRVFYNIITEVTSHHLGHILLVKSKSLGPAHVQERGFHRARTQEEGHHWESCQKMPSTWGKRG